MEGGQDVTCSMPLAAGAILEISLRVGVIPLNVSHHIDTFSDHFSQFIFTKSPVTSSKSYICCILYKTSCKSLRSVGSKT